MKKLIIIGEPCQPKGSFPKHPNSKRSFSSEYYSFKTPTGQKVDRFWLCYSPTLDGVYCLPCWLYSENIEARSWRDGSIRDWKGLSKKIKSHETSNAHLQACLTYATWKKNKTVADQISDERKKWKDIFTRIVDVIRTMAMCSLPFRGHRESLDEIGPERGNFLNIISLVSRYDSLLSAHLENEKSRAKYLHHDVQNQIICLLGRSVLNSLLKKIHSAPFFLLLLIVHRTFQKQMK